MNLVEYIQNLASKSTNNQLENLAFRKVKLTESLGFIEIMKTINPQKWTARIIQEEKYLFFNNKFLNVSKFKQEIDKIYSENGYSNFGFAKIPAEDLVHYKKIKDLIMPTFYDVMTDEIDPSIVAKILYDNEYKEFDWQPEEVQ